MTNRSHDSKDARKLEKLYDTKRHGTNHSTVLRLIQEKGLDGAIEQLEAWGMRRVIGPTTYVDTELRADATGRLPSGQRVTGEPEKKP